MGYNSELLFIWKSLMAKIKPNDLSSFGARLAAIRKAAGYTQTELGEEIGVSQRVVAYYEVESEHPPVNLLPKLAQALNVTTDELLGLKEVKQTSRPDNRLQRRVKAIEKMDPKSKRKIIKLLDTFIESFEKSENVENSD